MEQEHFSPYIKLEIDANTKFQFEKDSVGLPVTACCMFHAWKVAWMLHGCWCKCKCRCDACLLCVCCMHDIQLATDRKIVLRGEIFTGEFTQISSAMKIQLVVLHTAHARTCACA